MTSKTLARDCLQDVKDDPESAAQVILQQSAEIERLQRFAWWVECGDFESTKELQQRAHDVLGGAAPETPGELERLKDGLRFYAEGQHMLLGDRAAWDTVSGEPQNWLCDNAGTATIEDGTLAKQVLAGHTMRWDAQGELMLEPPPAVPRTTPHE